MPRPAADARPRPSAARPIGRRSTRSPGSRSGSPTSIGPRRRPAADASRSELTPQLVPTVADHVRIYEVGPRDGLQNEPRPIPLATKLRYLELLADAGLRDIETTSFVAPAAIPQLADADELMAALPRRPGVRYPVLVPNLRGLARAEAVGIDAIAVFTAATDAFTTRNIRMTVDDSLEVFAPVLARAGELGWWRRGYVSTAFGCA